MDASGWRQIRVDVEGAFVRSAAGRETLSLLELAAAWKTQFQVVVKFVSV